MQTRRQFLKDASKTVLATSLVPVAALAEPRRRAVAPERLSYETFARLVQTRFRAFAEGGLVAELVLVKAEAQPETTGGECFSLLFRGSGREALEQGTYQFAHARLGQFDMFVVPQPADGNGYYLEAVFNRLHFADPIQFFRGPQR